MKIEGIKHVFFDLDHTLWDFDKNSSLTFKKILKLNGVDVNISEFIEAYKPINLHYWKLFRMDQINKSDLRFRRLKDTFIKLNVSVNAALIKQLSKDYIAHLSTFSNLLEGSLEILNYLYSKYKLHIITNGFSVVQQNKLNNAKINHYFCTVTNSETVGVKKPNPKIFHFALNKANAIPKQCIMIGDNLEADVLGALAIGIDAICLNYNNDEIEKNIKTISNLVELKKYI